MPIYSCKACMTSYPLGMPSLMLSFPCKHIHHADIQSIKLSVKEITRVLKPGGFLFVTVPKLVNQARNYRQIEPNTLVPLDGAEKGLPHHYFTPQEMREVFAEFNVTDIHVDDTNHYCLWAFKR